ncbi:MAG: hypothetical protein NVS3B24_23420 [Candidatus Dormibacteria bacterium]
MVRSGDEFRIGPGETLRFITTTASSDGQVVEVRARYEPGNPRPPAHYHPRQGERIEILSGTLKAKLGGNDFSLSPGDVMEIPPGAVHQMWNEGPNSAETAWRTSPALGTEEFFKSLDRWYSTSGGLGSLGGVLAAAPTMIRFREEFRLASPPYLVQRVAFPILAALARLLNLTPPSS